MEKKKKVLIGLGAAAGVVAAVTPFVYKKMKKVKLETKREKEDKKKVVTKGE